MKACFIICALWFLPIQSVLEEKPLVIVIPSYNNSAFYQRNLDSVFCQKYNNYRVIYIDDCSTDNTGQLVERYIKNKHQEHRCTLIKNNNRRYHLANHYTAVHLCDSTDIIVHLDGDDWFTCDTALAVINSAYQNPNIWLTYGQFIHYPTNRPGICGNFPNDILERRDFRNYDWITSHPRTFYAGLFKQIKLKDLFYNGEFIPICADRAMMYPMLEMAGKHIKFINTVLYAYNMINPLNLFKSKLQLQQLLDSYIKSRKKYPPKDSPIAVDNTPNTANLVVFAQNTILLTKVLYALERYCTDISTRFVIINSVSKELQESFPNYIFIQKSTNLDTINTLLQQIFSQSPSGYTFFVFAHDRKCINKPVNIASCVQKLKQTYAHGFYLNADSHYFKQKSIPHVMLDDQFGAWQLTLSAAESSYVIYSNKKILKRLAKKTVHSPAELIELLNTFKQNSNNLGLFFKQSILRCL